jgi:hypothetical protein
MALRHRLRKDPLERVESGERIDLAVDEMFPQSEPPARLAAIK